MHAGHPHRWIYLTILRCLVLKSEKVYFDLVKRYVFMVKHVFDSPGSRTFPKSVKSKFHFNKLLLSV